MAVAAVVIGAVAVAVVLLGGGSPYKVKAQFQNASQLVSGDQVQFGGVPVGTVTGISLTHDGQALVTLNLDKSKLGRDHSLHQGIQAVVRQASLSGIANRYIDLRAPAAGTPKIPDGGLIPASSTTSAVDLDQVFDIFGPKERKALSGVIRGSAAEYAGKGPELNAGLRYLNPSIAATSRLFRELNRDTPLFERFILANSQLVSDVAQRHNDLSGLIDNLATTTGALGRQRTALADAIRQLPAFMRRSNTTFVNLRATLNDLKPLVNESKPVAKKLRPFLAELRPLARDARPTLHELSQLIKNPQPNSDLITLANSNVPVRDIAVGPVQRNGKQREGALPATTKALKQSVPELASARPYAVDLVGWFNDFSHTGFYDALGGISRSSPNVNAFAVINGVLSGPVPPALRGPLFDAVATLGQNDRCPGAMERNPSDGSAAGQKPPGVSCDPTQIPPGP